MRRPRFIASRSYQDSPRGGKRRLAAGSESPQRCAQTANSLPLGSVKWNRRPPGNGYGSCVIVAPAVRTSGQRRAQVVRVDDDERPAGACFTLGQPTDFAAPAHDARVVGTVVVEAPPECRGVERLGFSHVLNGELEVVDRVVNVHECSLLAPATARWFVRPALGAPRRASGRAGAGVLGHRGRRGRRLTLEDQASECPTRRGCRGSRTEQVSSTTFAQLETLSAPRRLPRPPAPTSPHVVGAEHRRTRASGAEALPAARIVLRYAPGRSSAPGGPLHVDTGMDALRRYRRRPSQAAPSRRGFASSHRRPVRSRGLGTGGSASDEVALTHRPEDDIEVSGRFTPGGGRRAREPPAELRPVAPSLRRRRPAPATVVGRTATKLEHDDPGAAAFAMYAWPASSACARVGFASGSARLRRPTYASPCLTVLPLRVMRLPARRGN